MRGRWIPVVAALGACSKTDAVPDPNAALPAPWRDRVHFVPRVFEQPPWKDEAPIRFSVFVPEDWPDVAPPNLGAKPTDKVTFGIVTGLSVHANCDYREPKTGAEWAPIADDALFPPTESDEVVVLDERTSERRTRIIHRPSSVYTGVRHVWWPAGSSPCYYTCGAFIAREAKDLAKALEQACRRARVL